MSYPDVFQSRKIRSIFPLSLIIQNIFKLIIRRDKLKTKRGESTHLGRRYNVSMNGGGRG